MIPHQLKEKASNQRWFNAFDFGEFQTRGREEQGSKVFNSSLFGVFDLLSHIQVSGIRCIDIGSGSGLVALGLKAMGASYVAAADGIHHPAFDTAREITGLDIDFRQVGVENIVGESDWIGSFDLVISSGLMYHLISPFQLIHAAKKLLKPKGLFILQSLCRLNDPDASLFLNSERNINGDPTTYFVPGINAVRGMLKLGLFDILAERHLIRYKDFVAFLARSESNPDCVTKRAPNTATIHERLGMNPGYNFGGYSFYDFISDAEPSQIRYSSPEDIATIEELTYKCRFPYNPTSMTNPVGLKYR
jgi:2-polyprenyl-3-methyl-5-hydroxy-6-metoxy-1,4-benzoquinol methylase